MAALAAAAALLVGLLPPGVLAQTSPFSTGAAAAQTSMLTILSPLSAVAVMVSGVLGWFGKISWWWLVGVVIGTVLVFGAPQIVSWIRSMAGV